MLSFRVEGGTLYGTQKRTASHVRKRQGHSQSPRRQKSLRRL